MRLKLMMLLLFSMIFACKKEEVKKADDQTPPNNTNNQDPVVTATTDFREAYTGKFLITVHEHSATGPAGPGIDPEIFDMTVMDTVYITYSISDSITLPATNIKKPAFKFRYYKGIPYHNVYNNSTELVGFDSSERLYIRYSPGNNNAGGFVSVDSINHVQYLLGGRYSYNIFLTGHRIK